MRLLSIAFLSILLSLTAFGQSRASKCYFGNSIINFDYTPFQVEITNLPTSGESPASICDENGQLQFYSNGGPHSNNSGGVWNYTTQFMENGTPFDSAGCWSTYAGASAIPVPNANRINTGQYYLFTKDCLENALTVNASHAGLNVSLIDMTANGGEGTVVSKYTTVVPYEVVSAHSTNYEPIALINQSNGYDYWLFSYTKDSICRVAVTSNGIGSPELLFPGGGKIVFSPAANYAVFGEQLYSFNATTGNLAHVGAIPNGSGYFSVAFSSSGNYLYTLDNGQLKQYDCTSGNILASAFTVSNNQSAASGTLFLTANTRIFICGSNASYFTGQITCPNNGGAACGYDGTDLPLNGGITGTNTFTNIPANFLYSEATSCSLGSDEEELSGVLVHTTYTDFMITGEALGNLSVTMIDIQGKLVELQHGIDHVTINRTTLQAGTYLLNVTATSGKTRRFLVVNH